ncbi:iron-sulfur cluster repair di-iron protein [Clostridium estertheticum]|uniref:iron-sulfur cluster repair di-iron protein n=1 Tax=Clostridium estertheticum TaxID=238834 RepID=UPI0013E92070|nr:iron-sulfur cluster repair di-iron protein [Clostridium estertheticum]MBZ9687844.1 iron-sulfur cluster repair di-iron protein [Clostridium estertheticum]
MNNKFKTEDAIGQIVAAFPGASEIFYKYNIDFCCGGDRPLSLAISTQCLDGKMIIEELNTKYQGFEENNEKFTDWAKESPSKLIEYVVNNHHAYLNVEMPKISKLLLKILGVHGKNHEELFVVHRLFNNLRTELEEHLVKEEEFLFPLIVQYENGKDENVRSAALKLIDELEQEHTGAGDIIKELREITDHYNTPKDGCGTFVLTYKKLLELEVDLFQHIHLENNILFNNF